MSDRCKLPPERDFGFWQRRKHDKWREVAAPEPALEAAVADSHAHVHMLPDPAHEFARCAANNVDFVCEITDPSEDGPRPFDELAGWLEAAAEVMAAGLPRNWPEVPKNPFAETDEGGGSANRGGFPAVGASNPGERLGFEADLFQRADFLAEEGEALANSETAGGVGAAAPQVRIAVGVHPHNAKLYTPEIEAELLERLADPRVAALGEIGLDYHYDLSPRELQRDVFRRQIAIARECDLPIALHLRGGEDPERDNAHREAFAILREAGALGPRTLLHCCALPPDELRPWIEADCYIAYGGALTFKNGAAAREGALLVPVERLMLETDSPYMTPEPMRGAACTPAHVIFTAAALADIRGAAPGESRRAFLQQIHDNTLDFYRA